MAVPVTVSWEEIAANGGAYRPNLVTTLGGAQLQDETGKAAPATDGSELNGVMVNQWVKQIAAMARTAVPIRMTINWSSGVAFLEAFDACSSILLNGDITVITNGAGDVTLQWAALSKLPPLNTSPMICVNATSLTTPNAAVIIVGNPPANTVQIRCQVKDGSTLTNARFTVWL